MVSDKLAALQKEFDAWKKLLPQQILKNKRENCLFGARMPHLLIM
jgi:hypothetical protein